MGVADDMVEGMACCLCGCYFQSPDDRADEIGDETIHVHGYPVVCWECWRDLSKEQRKQYQRALARTI